MRYASIRELDISNGEGIGVALFVQGCRFACKNCFNPDTWDFNGGKEWTPNVKEKFLELIDRPYIKRVSILGGEPLADENLDGVLDLVTEINKKYNFQKVDSANPCKMGVSEVKNSDEIRLSLPNKSIWIYSGFTWESIMNYEPSETDDFDYIEESYIDGLYEKRKEIISKCTVMVDGKYIDSERDITLKWKGSKNQRVIDVQQSLQQNRIVLYCD